jgi:hypothetical protein
MDKTYSKKIQRGSRSMPPPCETMQWRVVLRSCKKTDVGASIVESVKSFCRKSFCSNTVMDSAPSVTIGFVDKNGTLVRTKIYGR